MSKSGIEYPPSAYGPLGSYLLHLALLRRCRAKETEDGEVLE